MTAQTVISAKYPPHIDVTRTPLAFGDRAVPRLVSFITHKNGLEDHIFISYELDLIVEQRAE